MAYTAMELLGGALGSGALSSVLTFFATRKKDSGDLATALVQTLMQRVSELEAQQKAERENCDAQLKKLRGEVSKLTMKLEVLRAKAKVPSDEWAAIESEFDAEVAHA